MAKKKCVEQMWMLTTESHAWFGAIDLIFQRVHGCCFVRRAIIINQQSNFTDSFAHK